MKKLVFIFLLFSVYCFSDTLEENEVYRLDVNISVAKNKNDAKSSSNLLTVGANSKFRVIDNSLDDFYIVVFNKIYSWLSVNSNPKDKNDVVLNNYSQVIEGKYYYVKKFPLEDSISLKKFVKKSFAGITSGPLIVPFKYRLDDKSIAGETMIGYYAGYGMDFFNTNVAFTPFLSAGISQINESSLDSNKEVKNDNKSGFTWAAGILIQNWDKVNIGLVYGQDRIGDSSWEHEGKGWFSLSVGWNLGG